jgi:anti-sigma B factor antagonist
MSEIRSLICPIGVLDSTVGEQVRLQLLEALATGSQSIVIDCTSISLMDSNGFSFLIACLKKARESSVQLLLRNPNPQMRLVLEMTGTDQLFDIDDGFSASST